MKIGKLRQVTVFWNNLTFTGNMCRMRSALSKYLSEEGLKSRIEDGLVLFEFDKNQFCVSFCMDKGYPECEISYEIEDEDYEDNEYNNSRSHYDIGLVLCEIEANDRHDEYLNRIQKGKTRKKKKLLTKPIHFIF